MRFTIAILPNGKVIIATPPDIEMDQLTAIREAFAKWREGPEFGALFVPGEVVLASDVEMHVPEFAEIQEAT